MTDGAVNLSETTMVLLLAPAVGDRPMDACVRALEGIGEDIDQVTAVTVTDSARDWLSIWDRTSLSEATPVTCIDVDAGTRSTTQRVSSGATTQVDRIHDPSDLEAIGRRVSDVLDAADEADDATGIVVHSLSGILQHVDESTAFKFVYTLGEVIRRVDGIVFFHLDPGGHDAETVETFRIVCDAVIDCDRAGRRQS